MNLEPPPRRRPSFRPRLALAAGLVLPSLAWAQPATTPAVADLAPLPVAGLPAPPAANATPPVNTRFDLDFPGGRPVNLVQEISAARGVPVNAIIPPDLADAELPPMKLTGVTADQVFAALIRANATRPGRTLGVGGVMSGPVVTSGFRTDSRNPDDRAVWYFYADRPAGDPPTAEAPVPEPMRLVRVFNLASYLPRYQVEDITTAVRTGWGMMPASGKAQLSFHEDTKLLIAVGSPEELGLIEQVLQELQLGMVNPVTGALLPVAPEAAHPGLATPALTPSPTP